jgi:hypothetical protein
MQELGDFLERLGPAFGVLFLSSVIGVGIILVVLSTRQLVRRNG